MVIYNKSFKERLNFNWLEHSTAKENSSIYFLSVPINQFFHASDVLNFAMKEESNWLKQSGWWVWCLFIYTQKVCLLFEKKIHILQNGKLKITRLMEKREWDKPLKTYTAQSPEHWEKH